MPDTTTPDRDRELTLACAEYGFDPAAELRIGGRYTSLVRDGRQLYLSGQIPRVGDQIAVVGTVGADVTLADAQRAAAICAVRALLLLQRELGSLDKLKAVMRLTVFVHCSADFTQHSEVADGASDLLWRVLGQAGVHTRTSVGVLQLPKGAAVEVDLIASALEEGA